MKLIIWNTRGADKSLARIERPLFFVWRGGHCCRGDLVRRKNFRIFFEWL